MNQGKLRRNLTIPFICIVLAGIVPQALAVSGDIYNLGSFGGHSIGRAINNNGQVAGYSHTGPDAITRAFRYDGIPGNGGTMWNLGTLGGTISTAFGINDAGQVVGSSRVQNSQRYHAYRYDGTPGLGGAMVDLGTLGGNSSFAHDINNAGQIVGYSTVGPYADIHGFLVDSGTMYDLGTLDEESSRAHAINEAGQVTGFYYTYDEPESVFRFDSIPGGGGVMHAIGPLGARYTSPTDINASGEIVGWLHQDEETYHAFRFSGTPGSLLILASVGGLTSDAQAINDAGIIVGTSESSDRWGRATLWRNDKANTPVNLDAWLDVNNPAAAANWYLQQVNDINDNGLITGYGTYNDGPGGESDGLRAFIFDVSELALEHNGDFDDDDEITPADMDLLFDAVGEGSYSTLYDVNADMQVTAADLIYQVQSIIDTHIGDADLDLDVDLADLASLASGYGQPNGTWASGDFDGDGDVDLNDLSSLAANYGSGEAQAFADFQSLIPEPAMLAMLPLAAVLRRQKVRRL